MKKNHTFSKTLKQLTPEQRPLLVTLLTLLSASSASALDWSNAEIRSGDILGKTENGVTNIFQSSGKGIIDWGNSGNGSDPGFNLAAGEVLNLFNGASGTTLMRDITGSASKILGAINATGSIWVVNKSGVFIGSNAAIDVGKQFLAVAGDISDSDFTGGTYRFTDVGGEVWNVGTIKAGDDVILIGAKVVNQGRIQASDQLAIGGFSASGAGESVLANNVGGGKITFSVTTTSTAGSIVNEGQLESLSREGRDIAPAADISGLSGKIGGTAETGAYSAADKKVTYTSGEFNVTTSSGPNATASGTAINLQAKNSIAILQGVGGFNAGDLALEAATIKQSSSAETAPAADLGTGAGGTGTLNVSGDATFKATGGDLALGDAEAGKTVSIEATGSVSVGNLKGTSVSVTGAKVTAGGSVTATSDSATITATSGTATVNGDVTAGTDATIKGATVATAGVTATDGEVSIEATNAAMVTGDVTAGTDATIKGTTVATAGVSATSGDVSIESTTGDASIGGNVVAGTDATISAATAATVTGNVTAGTDATIKGATVTAAGVTATSGDVSIEATNVATVTGDVNAGTDATIKGATVSAAAVTAGQDVSIEATSGNATVISAVTAGADATISATGDVTVNGVVTADGEVSIEATNAATVNGDVNAGTDATIKGATVTAAGVTATSGDVSIEATSGNATVNGDVNAGQGVAIEATAGIEATGDISAAGDVTITNSISGGIVTNGTIDGQEVTLANNATDGNVTVNGAVIASIGDASIKATDGDVTVNGAVTADGEAIISADGTATATAAVEGSSVTVTGDTVETTAAGTLTATTDDVIVTATNGIEATGDISATGDVSVTNSTSGDIVTNGTIDGQAVTLANVATDGDVAVNGAVTATDEAIISAAGAATATAAVEGSSVTVTGDTVETTADGTLTATRGDVIVTAANGIEATGDISATGTALIQATSGTATVNGAVTAGTAATISAATAATVTGDVTATTGTATIMAVGNASVSGAVTAGTDATIKGITVTTSGTVTAGGDASIKAVGGAATVQASVRGASVTVTGYTVETTADGTLTATTDDVTIEATGGSATLAGTIAATGVNGEVDITATETVTLQATIEQSGVGTDGTGANAGVEISAKAVESTAAGTISATSVKVEGTESVTLAGAIAAKGDATATQDATMVEVTGAEVTVTDVTATTDGAAITPTYNMDGVLTGFSDNASGNVDIIADDSDATVNGTLYGRDVTVTSLNSDVAGTGKVVASETATLSADNGSVTLSGGSISAALDVQTSGDIHFLDAGGNPSALAIKDINLHTTGGEIKVTENVISSTGTVTLVTESTANGTIEVGGDIRSNAQNDADSTGNILVSSAKTLQVGGDVVATAGANHATEGHVTLQANDDLAVGGDVTTAQGDLTATAAGAVTMGDLSGADVEVEGTTLNVGTVTATGDVDLNATTGDATIQGAIAADGDVDILAATDITANGTVIAGNDATLTAGGNIALNAAAEAGIRLTLDADESVTLDGLAKAPQVEVTARRGDILTNKQDTLLVEADQATLAAAGKIGTAAKPILTKVGELSAAAGYDVNNRTPIPTAQSGIYLIQTEDNWTITGLRDFGTGNILAYNKEGLTIVDGEILNKQGNVILAGANGVEVEANRTVTAEAGAVTLQGDAAGSAVTLEGNSTVSASEDIFLEAGSVAMAGSAKVTTAGEHVGIRATAGDVTLGDVKATEAIAVQASGSIYNAAGRTEDDVNLAAKDILLDARANIGNAADGEPGYVTVSAEHLQARAAAGEAAIAAKGDLTVQEIAPVDVTRVNGTTAEATDSERMGVATMVGILSGTQVRLAVEENLDVAGAIVAGQGDLLVVAGEDVTLRSGNVVILAGSDASVRAGQNLALEAGTTIVAGNAVNGSSAFVTAGGDLTMSADANGSTIQASGNAVLEAGGNAALDHVISANGSIGVTAGGDILDAQGDETVYSGDGQAILAGGENLVAANGSVSLLAGGTIGAATRRGDGGSATAPIDALEVKAQQVSARAGKDLAIQSSGDLAIGTVGDIAAATHGAQSGIVAGGTANLIAKGEIVDGTGAGTDITAEKAVLTAGRGAGRTDALEVVLSGSGEGVLWGNGVKGVSGDSVAMNVQTVGGNTDPNTGAKKFSDVVWLVNGRYFGGDSRYIGPMQNAVGSLFEALPLTIRTNEVFTPFTFLSLDLGILPPAGQGYIDYPRPVRRQTEHEEAGEARDALRKQ
ncbi:MAG: hypothetical protein ACI4QA_02715 [Candidatus Spyradosoma sp.]